MKSLNRPIRKAATDLLISGRLLLFASRDSYRPFAIVPGVARLKTWRASAGETTG